MITNKDTKWLIRAARTFEQADNVLSETWCDSINDKIEYLRQLFPRELGNIKANNYTEDDYKIIVMSVIHSEDNQPYMWGYKDGCKYGEKDGYEEAVRHILQNWNELRGLSEEGAKEYFQRLLHKEIEDRQNT